MVVVVVVVVNIYEALLRMAKITVSTVSQLKVFGRFFMLLFDLI